MHFRRILGISAFFLCFFAVSQHAYAATLYVDPYTVDLLKGDTITVAIRLDTDEGECINTVDGVLKYSETIQAVDISRGRSILTLWVEDPVIDTTTRTITFAGGIPNGYCGRIPGDPSLTNVVAEIAFRAPSFSVGRPDDITALITFEPGTRVLLNDGLGTDAPLKTLNGAINLLQQVGNTPQDTWRTRVNQDTVPPQEFSVELVKDSSVFSGKYYIVFNTTDKQSGIDRYEVYEEPREDLYDFRWGRADIPWAPIESPYVLRDQELRSTIRVKAIDKAGNERIVTLVPDDSLRPLPIAVILVSLVGVVMTLVCVGLIAWWLLRRRRKREDVTIEPL